MCIENWDLSLCKRASRWIRRFFLCDDDKVDWPLNSILYICVFNCSTNGNIIESITAPEWMRWDCLRFCYYLYWRKSIKNKRRKKATDRNPIYTEERNLMNFRQTQKVKLNEMKKNPDCMGISYIYLRGWKAFSKGNDLILFLRWFKCKINLIAMENKQL